jgi:hypothetical protein
MEALATGLPAAILSACALVIGIFIKRGSDNRRDAIEQNELRIHEDAQNRLRLEAAMQAADLFDRGAGVDANTHPAATAAALLSLTQMQMTSLAVTILFSLWSTGSRHSVTTGTAILVIDSALLDRENPSGQLMAAELLCLRARSLDPCNSVEWPHSIDGGWIDDLPMRARLLVVEALVRMTCNSKPSENALRSIAVRLMGAYKGESGNVHAQECLGVLIKAIEPAMCDVMERGDYKEVMWGSGRTTIKEIQDAAQSAKPNPDGYLARLVKHYETGLETWSEKAAIELEISPGTF